MRIVVSVIRSLVGILFIISGLVKANDPLGLSYKMDEFFSKWNWNWASSFSLYFSIAIITFEIFAGVALLLGWKPKIVTRLLLLLILFFTFLTGYAYLSGKFHSCGCFGDCIPITSGQSFTKDILLLILILILFIYNKFIPPIFSEKINFSLSLLSAAISIFLMIYVLQHLPFKDCLPYAKGKDLIQQMQLPPGSKPDSVVVYFKYKKNGKEVKFDANHFPDDFNDSTYEYIDRENVVVRKGATPAITDFTLKTMEGLDTTQQILSYKGTYVLFFARDFTGNNEDEWYQYFQKLYTKCKEKKIPVVVVSNMAKEANYYFNEMSNYMKPSHYGIAVLTCDGTVMKTFLRAKMGIVIMNGSVVKEKFNINNTEKAIKTLNN